MDKIFDFYSKYQTLKHLVDDKLRLYRESDQPLLDGLIKSIYYSLEDGKRFRAIFTFLLGELYDIPEKKLLGSACALEMVHTASLIMGDLPYMGDSQLRRGKPANHVVFGQDVALLASIGLLSEGMQVVLDDAQLNADERVQIGSILSNSFGFNGLAAGQFVDLKLKDKHVDFEIIKFINQKKTAALFMASGQIAAIIGQADETQMKAIQEFSRDIGFAFQIVDDMLDVMGQEKVVGKNVAQDKMNFVKLVGIDQAREYLDEYHQRAEKALEVFGAKADGLKEFSQYLIERVR